MSIDRRTLMTAMLGVCAVAGGLGAAATTASAVPRAAPPSRTGGEETAEAMTEGGEGEATLQNVQYWRRRRPWWWWRRRRRRWRRW